MSEKHSVLLATVLSLMLSALSSAAQAQGLRVEVAGLEAYPVSYNGPCPGLIKFKGNIHASGAGRVSYTYTYSDGASGPAGFVDFEGPGVKHVETTWRLGDASTLPRYEGWAVLKVLSPNAYESNRAGFVLECTQGGSQPPSPPTGQPQPTPGGTDDFVQTYLSELPRLSAAQRQKFDADLDRLKALSEELQPKLAAARKQLGFDSEEIHEEFRAIAEVRDEAKRAESGKAFGVEYEARVLELLRVAGLDAQSERMRLTSLINLSTAQPIRGSLIGVGAMEEGKLEEETPSKTPPPPDTTEQVFGASFTGAGTYGGDTAADRVTGTMSLSAAAHVAASEQRRALVTQRLDVEGGVRYVRATATLRPVSYSLSALAAWGYSSSEAIVNLRVMEGARVVCSDRFSLALATSLVIGWSTPAATRPLIVLHCEFARPAPDAPATYHLVAEIEGWAGAGGPAGATVSMSGTLRQFQVLLRRR